MARASESIDAIIRGTPVTADYLQYERKGDT